MSPKISEESKIQKKSYIIDNAMKLFSQKGFVETSMEDIVKATGMSKGGIYNYFKSKEEIFLAIAEDRFNKRHSLIESFEKSDTSTEKLKKYIQRVLGGLFEEDTLLNARFTFEFWSVVSRNPETLVAAKKRYALFHNDLESILKQGVDDGEFNYKLDIDSMIYIILSSTDGIGFFNSVMGVPLTEAIIENHIDMILRKLIGGNEYDSL